MNRKEVIDLRNEARELKRLSPPTSSGKERYQGAVEGEYLDILTNIRTGEQQVFHGKNIIVSDFSKLIAGLLSGEGGYAGITYWAVGQGEGVSWDSLTTTQRQAKSVSSLTALYNEITRVVAGLNYLDAYDNVTTTVTGKLEVTATFGAAVSGYLREFGLYGANASVAINSGVMVNHRAHAVIGLNIGVDTLVLTRTLWLTL